MLHPIESHDDVFSSPAYEADRTAFTLLEVIRQQPILLLADDRTTVLGRNAPDMPVWVWTADDLPGTRVQALTAELAALFPDTTTFVAKPGLCDQLAAAWSPGRPVQRSVLMNAYVCLALRPSRFTGGAVRQPGPEDLDWLAEFAAGFLRDIHGLELSPEARRDKARSYLDRGNALALWVDGAPVAMAASAYQTERLQAVNAVYTAPAHRCKGYAGRVVGAVCERILAAGKLPMLYADAANPASNKAYRSIGFAYSGQAKEMTL